MNFIANTAPNYRTKRTTTKIMLILMAGLFLLWVASILFNFLQINATQGLNAILVVFVAQIATAVTDIGILSIRYRKKIGSYADYIYNGWLKNYSYVTAMILALCLPTWTPLYVVAVGAIFATAIGKYVFGGFGHNIFNPAAIGRIFIALTFGGTLIPPNGITATAGQTITTVFANSGPKWGLADLSVTGLSLSDAWLGLYPGAIGETFTLLILAIGVALAVLKVINWRTPAFYLGTVVVTAFFIAVFTQQNILNYILVHLSLGGLMFGAVFMLTDPVTGPTSPYGKALAGVIAGLLTMLIRIQGSYPEGVVFAIVLTNMVSPMIDNFATGLTNKNQWKKWSWIGGTLVVSVALNSGLAGSHYQVYAAEQQNIANTLSALNLGATHEYQMLDANAIEDEAALASGLQTATVFNLSDEETIYGIVYDGSLALYDGTIDFKVGMVDKLYVGFVLEKAQNLNSEQKTYLTDLETLINPALELKVTSDVTDLRAKLSAPTEVNNLLNAFVQAGTHFANLVPQAEVFATYTGSYTSEYSPDHVPGQTTTTTVTVEVDQMLHLIDLQVDQPTSGGNFETNWLNNWSTVKNYYLGLTVGEIIALTVTDLALTDGAVSGLTITSNRLLLALHDAFNGIAVYSGSATSEYDPEYSSGQSTTTDVTVYVDTDTDTIITLDIVNPTSGGNFAKTFETNIVTILSAYQGVAVADVQAYTSIPTAGAVSGITYTVERILLAVQNALAAYSGI